MLIDQERMAAWDNDAMLMRWIAEHLRDYIAIPAEYIEAENVLRVEGYGVVDTGVLTDVMDKILREIAQDPTRLLNDPSIGDSSHYLTMVTVLCGGLPRFTDDWLYWLTQRVLRTTPAGESAPTAYCLSYEAKFRGVWGPELLLLSAGEVEEAGARLATLPATGLRNVAVYHGKVDVTDNFECFRK